MKMTLLKIYFICFIKLLIHYSFLIFLDKLSIGECNIWYILDELVAEPPTVLK